MHDVDLDPSRVVNKLKNPVVVAATHGIPDISFLVAARFYDNEGCNLFQRAVLFRHHKVFSLISRISHEQKLIVTDNMDNFSNNMLHLVKNLAPPDQLNRLCKCNVSYNGFKISKFVFSLYHEVNILHKVSHGLMWRSCIYMYIHSCIKIFVQEVEKVVPNIYQYARNIEIRTPRMVFTKEHKELVKEGERWMKGAANSCSVVAALIATVVFATAITLLGGTNGNREFLVFKSEKAFVIFAMSDALFLFSSTTAILMFLSMLTARYVEDDFLQALPKRLIMGFLTLFISITTMMIAFSSTLYLRHKTWILVCVAESTRVLVTLVYLSVIFATRGYVLLYLWPWNFRQAQ
ncbi:Ankyrin repeat-containing-like protein [Gossypium australe]|uniref:Ankyrin repeat-containing-like protein n=1 Tax=Gossypium australe TaxID=47621 RepID=A0A5B6W5F8_9ROSI|nr:Ankyrin repeat-containing-like protein [Gossypium australe]